MALYASVRLPWLLLALGPFVAFFGTGYFSGFGAVTAEIYPTRIRATALESIGRIPSLEAGDFLIEALRYEPEPLRGLARRLLTEFDNREIIPILRQHYYMETGPRRADLEAILRQVGGLAGAGQ